MVSLKSENCFAHILLKTPGYLLDIQPKVMQAIIAANGGHTKYMSSGAAS